MGLLNLNGGEWRLLSETHNPPAGRNGSSPPSPAAPRGRRPPASLQRRADRAAAAPTAKRMGNPATLPRSDKTDPLSEEQRLRKVQKGREILQRSRATKDAKDRGAPGVAAHRFLATFEGRDNITGRFVAPVENPFKMCAPPPCDATPWSLCAPPGSPESPVTRAAEAQILMETDRNLGRPASTRPDSACA